MSLPRITWTRALLVLPVLPIMVLLLSGNTPRVERVEVSAMERGRLVHRFTAFGETILDHPLAVTAPATGQIRDYSLRPGDTVRRGQTLLRLHSGALEQSRAALEGRIDLARRERMALERATIVEPDRIAADMAKAELDRNAALELLARAAHLEDEAEMIALRSSLAKAEIELAEGRRQLDAQGSLHEKGIASKEGLSLLRGQIERHRIDVEFGQKELHRLMRELGVQRERRAALALAEAESRIRLLHRRKEGLKLMERELACARASEAALGDEARVLDRKIADCVVRSPIAGLVLESPIIEGSWAQEGTTLLKLADPSRVTIRLRVDEIDLPRIHRESTAIVSSDALPTSTFPAKVLRILPRASSTEGSRSTRLPVELKVTPLRALEAPSTAEAASAAEAPPTRASDRLQANMTVQADFEDVLAENALRLPVRSIWDGPLPKSGTPPAPASGVASSKDSKLKIDSESARQRRKNLRSGFVHVCRVGKSAPHELEFVRVEIGTRDAGYFEVRSGLQPGDLVVLSPGKGLRDGQIVNLKAMPAEGKNS